MSISERILLALSVISDRPRYDLGQKAITRYTLKSFAQRMVDHDRLLQPSEFSDWRIEVIANDKRHQLLRAHAVVEEGL